MYVLVGVLAFCGFYVVLEDISMMTGGSNSYGGYLSSKETILLGVDEIHSADSIFAAVLKDGNDVTSGISYIGGDPKNVQTFVVALNKICLTSYAFATVLKNVSMVVCGDEDFGDVSKRIRRLYWVLIRPIQHIFLLMQS